MNIHSLERLVKNVIKGSNWSIFPRTGEMNEFFPNSVFIKNASVEAEVSTKDNSVVVRLFKDENISSLVSSIEHFDVFYLNSLIAN